MTAALFSGVLPEIEKSDEVQVVFGDKTVTFVCSTDTARYRARTALKKEPGTIAWIDRFEEGSTFWDIGANVGVFSLYAAATRNCRVFAFEPVAANYYGLNCNILRNGFDETITALPIAVAEKSGIDTMRMRDNTIGTSLHVFGSNTDFKGDQFEPVWLQGALSLSIDQLCDQFGLAIPNYVKIDVDGIEVPIVRGGRQVFSSPACRSVLVEVDPRDSEELTSIGTILKSSGMVKNRSIPENTVRRKGAIKIYNLIYHRVALQELSR